MRPRWGRGRSTGQAAATLLREARELLSADRSRSAQAREAAQRAADQAAAIIRPSRRRADRLLAAEVDEFRTSINIAYDDLETGIGGLVGVASAYLDLGPAADAQRGFARVARRLAGAYSSVGMRERAAQFVWTYLQALPSTDRAPLAMCYTASLLAVGGAPEQLRTLARRYDPADYPDPIRSVVTILSERADHQDCEAERLYAAACAIGHVPQDLRIQCTLFAANSLLRKGVPVLALELLRQLYGDIDAGHATDARLLQAMGIAADRAGDGDAALNCYLRAWCRYDDLRYRVGSGVIRRAIGDELMRARGGALAVVAHRGDLARMLEFIESCRLQAMPDLAGSTSELDEVLTTGVHKPKESPVGARIVDPDRLPEPFRLAVADLFDNRADVSDQIDIHVGGVSSLAEVRSTDGLTSRRDRLDIERVMGHLSRPDDLWWSSWYERGVLYWVLCRNAAPVNGGALDIEDDDELRAALSRTSLAYRIDGPWPVDEHEAPYDLRRVLGVADSTAELTLTATLGRLLPEEVRSPGDTARRLFMSAAPELAPVPWPILPVDAEAVPAVRLVECFELRFLPSLAVLDRATRTGQAHEKNGEDELPFLLACNYFPTDQGPSPMPARRARINLAAREQCGGSPDVIEATMFNFMRYLRTLQPGTDGVAFFRTHYEWIDADPGMSGIALADGTIPSGLLMARDGDRGRTLLNLPSTMVMSCCSTSGIRERNGGETLGFGAVAMIAGARRLILTAVQIRDTPFTIRLDDMLIELAIRAGDHFHALRGLQLMLLGEWRRSIVDGRALVPEAMPAPDIWAQYQAFGV